VPHRPTLAERPLPTPAVDAVRLLLDGGSPDLDRIPVAAGQVLLGGATLVLHELAAIRALCRGRGHHHRIVTGIVDLANSYEVCPAAAVGVCGALVDEVRGHDPAGGARLIDAARSSFSDRELVAGTVALVAATTAYLADLVGRVPTDLHDEIHRDGALRPRPRTERTDG
jgi:hypothetical protein